MDKVLKAAIHIQIKKEAPIFQKNYYFKWLKEEFSEITCYDFDNHSDNFVMEAIFPILENSSKNIVFILSEKEVPLGKTLLFFQKLIQVRENTLIFYQGENKVLEKILNPFPHKKEFLEDNYQEEIIAFF